MRPNGFLLARFGLRAAAIMGAQAALVVAATAQSPDSRLRGYSEAAPYTAKDVLNYNPREVEGGIRAGGFLFMPKLDTGMAYDDNVRRVDRGKSDDFVLHVAPEVRAQSRWSRHLLDLRVGGALHYYVDESKELGGRFDAEARTVIDVAHDLKISAFSIYRFGQEEFGEGESLAGGLRPQSTRAVQYHVVQTGASVAKHFNRLWVEVGGAFTYKAYDDGVVPSFFNISEDFRTGSITEGISKVGYEFQPNTSLFIEARVNERDYGGTQFDSRGTVVLGGLSYEIGLWSRAEIAIGGMEQSTDTGMLRDVSTWVYRSALQWELSPFIRLAFSSYRELGAPSLIAGASSRVDTEVAARVDYSILRNLVLTGGVGFTWSDFQDIERTDKRLRLRAVAEYFYRPGRSTYISFDRVSLASQAPALDDFERNIVTVGVRMRF